MFMYCLLLLCLTTQANVQASEFNTKGARTLLRSQYVRVYPRGCCKYEINASSSSPINAESPIECMNRCHNSAAICISFEYDPANDVCVLWNTAAFEVAQTSSGPSDCEFARCYTSADSPPPQSAPSSAPLSLLSTQGVYTVESFVKLSPNGCCYFDITAVVLATSKVVRSRQCRTECLNTDGCVTVEFDKILKSCVLWSEHAIKTIDSTSGTASCGQKRCFTLPVNPTDHPATISPSLSPTTLEPALSPTMTTTTHPSSTPSKRPSMTPTRVPTIDPSFAPSQQPTESPSMIPSHLPSQFPSLSVPTMSPTLTPSTISPTTLPSDEPAPIPSLLPSTPEPTHIPSQTPSMEPTSYPSSMPSTGPTQVPTPNPSFAPSQQPTESPSVIPSKCPSMFPSSATPTKLPTMNPSVSPSSKPSEVPSLRPTKAPSANPSKTPSQGPLSTEPTHVPSNPPITSSPAAPTQQQCAVSVSSSAVSVSGDFMQYHKITITVDGPWASESQASSPFLSNRFEVVFQQGSSSTTVPGYFAADGNAAETSAISGTKWRAHFRPPSEGVWMATVQFHTGPNAAIDRSVGSVVNNIHGQSAQFCVSRTNKEKPDLRANGVARYLNQRYLQYDSGEYFLKVGADSPENFLGYFEFDQTEVRSRGNRITGPNTIDGLHHYATHVSDWRAGDPTWQGTKGKGIIGALNYLASKGMNTFSFLTYNWGGDGGDVWPFSSATSQSLMYDCSKLDQWEIVFDHAERLGLAMTLKMQERENDHFMDGGDLGTVRMLYFHELVARYAHHPALQWVLGEENRQSTSQRKQMAAYLKALDPYDHPITLHNYSPLSDRNLEQLHAPLLGTQSELSGASIQTSDAHRDVTEWVTRSEASGKPWCIANDEQGPSSDGIKPDTYWTEEDRMNAVGDFVWGTFMAGGFGVEAYFGGAYPQADQDCEDWRSRDAWWNIARHALQFFRQLPVQEMAGANNLISNADYCFRKTTALYIVYHYTQTVSSSTKIQLTENQQYRILWYDAVHGGELQTGSISAVAGGNNVHYGLPPQRTLPTTVSARKHWAAVLTAPGAPSNMPTIGPTAPTVSPSFSPSSPTGSPVPNPTASPTTWSPTSAPVTSRIYTRIQPRGCCTFSVVVASLAVIPSILSGTECKSQCDLMASVCTSIEYDPFHDSCVLWSAVAVNVSSSSTGPSNCEYARCHTLG